MVNDLGRMVTGELSRRPRMRGDDHAWPVSADLQPGTVVLPQSQPEVPRLLGAVLPTAVGTAEGGGRLRPVSGLTALPQSGRLQARGGLGERASPKTPETA